MKNYLRLINFQSIGPRCDITPIFMDFVAFEEMINDFSSLARNIPFDRVAGIDALGFIPATALAFQLKKGFIPIRKGGKLPVKKTQIEFVDYTKQIKILELAEGVISQGEKVLLMDEWIETGAQVMAAVQLIKSQGGIIAGILCIHMDENENTRSLKKNFRCISLTNPLSSG